MVGALRRPAQSLVGASKTTSTSAAPVASRWISARSAESTSWITLRIVLTGHGPWHTGETRNAGNIDCPSGQRAGPVHRDPCAPTLINMPDPVVSLETPALTVEPGGQTTTTVVVRNPGTIVENYRIDVLVGD